MPRRPADGKASVGKREGRAVGVRGWEYAKEPTLNGGGDGLGATIKTAERFSRVLMYPLDTRRRQPGEMPTDTQARLGSVAEELQSGRLRAHRRAPTPTGDGRGGPAFEGASPMWLTTMNQ